MKKVLALVLAVVMVLSLCACGSSVDASKVDEILATLKTMQATLDTLVDSGETAEEVSDTEETPAAADVDFQWNGQMEVWSILPTTAAPGLVAINDYMGEIMEAAGFTYVKKDAEGNPANQVSAVEDAIAAGNVGALMIAAMDVDLLQDVVADAIDAGIAVAMLGADPDYTIAGNVYTAYAITGMFAVEAAEDWVLQRVAEGGDIPTNADGQYEVACDVYRDIRDGVYRTNAMLGTVENSDILVCVQETSAYGDSSPFTKAYDNAQDVLGAHPDCHIFIAYEPAEAMGIASAIEEYCDANGLDLADYCVMPCYGVEDGFPEMYAAAQEDPSANAIKGYSTYGDEGDVETYGENASAQATGAHLADILLGVCGIDGYSWTYGETYFDTITAVNVYGYTNQWTFGEENPAAEYEVAD
jgi:ABC-type sugar transport system substrate-binding protein